MIFEPQITRAGIARPPLGASVGPRLLDDFQFVWMITGTARVRFNEQGIVAKPGMLLLRKPAMQDLYEWSPTQQVAHGYCHFELPAQQQALLAKTPQKMSYVEVPFFGPLLEHIEELLRSDDTVWSALLIPAIAHLAQVYANAHLLKRPLEALPLPVLSALKAMVGAIDQFEEAQSMPSLTDLSRTACVSPTHLCDLFKEKLNLSPLACLRQMRLERAVVLLDSSNLSVREIAHQTGFSNEFHFSTAFKKLYACSPRDHRRNVRSGDFAELHPADVLSRQVRRWIGR